MMLGSTASFSSPPQAEDSASATAGFVPKRYAHSDGVYWGSPETCDRLESGFYMPTEVRGAPALQKIATSTDDLLRLPDPTCDMLLEEFVHFWKRSPEMVKRGLMPKRGIMLYGPPGSGKTSAVQLMAHHMIKIMGGVVIVCNHPVTTARSLQLFRGLEPDRPVIILYEDIDAIIEMYHCEAQLLALLDGELQIGGVVNVATTNYPERLDPRFTDRPGRFDRITLVGMPLPDARRAYFAAKAPDVSEPRREQWVIASDGWSIAHLRELVVGHLVLGEDDQDVIHRLTNMREQLPKSDDSKVSDFGFHERSGSRLAAASTARGRRY